MATVQDVRFWERREQELARRLRQTLDEGHWPDPATVTAHYMVLGLRTQLQAELGRTSGR